MNTLRFWRAAAAVAVILCETQNARLRAQTTPQAPTVIQLAGPITAEQSRLLAAEGIDLLHYYGNGRYLASGRSKAFPPAARTTPSAAYIDDSLLERPDAERIDVTISLAYPGAEASLQQVLAQAEFTPAARQVEGGNSLSGSLPAGKLTALARHPYVTGVNPDLGEDVPYNMEVRTTSGVTALNSGIAGAPDLNGLGVVIGIGDGGHLGGHPDIGDRVVYSTTYYNAGWATHPDMVAGIIGSSGAINTRHRGVAPLSELVIEASSGITANAPTYLADYGMTITNNSYGPSFHCNLVGKYYGSSSSLDQQLLDYPDLMHVYASGNSGRSSCPGTEPTYGNIVAGPQTAKNTLTVGNLHTNRSIFVGSSAGPTFDGRLKPEIVAIGTNVTSTNRDDGYGTGSGTSYSSPAVAGILALLTERYRALNAGANPAGALLKAIACNTAEDLGPAGPDFRYGYGLLDAPRALSTVEAGDFASGNVVQGDVKTFPVQVATGMTRASMMLYWADAPGPTSNSGRVLINDLDLAVVTPAGDTVRPWVLDHTQPTALATQGTDTLNNIEQVTFDNPAPGTYTIVVRGAALALATSDFYVTWAQQSPAVDLVCPYGGEAFEPQSGNLIAWSASTDQTGTWTIEYRDATQSARGASTWQTVASGLANATRSYTWPTPATAEAYDIRVTNDASGLSDQTNLPVTAIPSARNLSGESLCSGDIALSWSPVAAATEYNVYRFDGAEMQLVQTVTQANANVAGWTAGETGYYSVAPKGATGEGPRAQALAVESQTNEPGCSSPLPVEWTQVSTRSTDTGPEVYWSVASETDNDFFEVMRGVPAGDTLSWEPIGSLAGRGTAYTAADYDFVDASAPPVPTLYYRVVQQDFDGTRSASAVVAHQRETSDTQEPSPLVQLVNPVGDVLYFTSTAAHLGEAELLDASGRHLARFAVSPGRNAIAWPGAVGSGLYLLRVRSERGLYTYKLTHR